MLIPDIQDQTITYSNPSPNLYKVDIYNSDEYFILERRNGSGFDQFTPDQNGNNNTPGILIWHAAPSDWLDFIEIEYADNNPAAGTYPGDRFPYPIGTIQNFSNETTPSSRQRDGSYTNVEINNIEFIGFNSGYGEVDIVDPPPSTPTGLTLSGSSGNPIILTWNANPETDIYEYIIYRKDPGTSTYRRIGTAQGTQYTDSEVTVGNKFDPLYCYRITAEDIIGQESNQSSEKCKNGDGPVGKIMILPKDFALHKAYPNPFNPSTSIRFDLPERSMVYMIIYDVLGREIMTLIHNTIEPGLHEIRWDGKDDNGNPVSTGMYIYQFSAFSEESQTQFKKSNKLVLMK